MMYTCVILKYYLVCPMTLYDYLTTTKKYDFPVAQMVKNLPATQETWVRSLNWEDPLEKGMMTHSSILGSRITQTEEPAGLQVRGS